MNYQISDITNDKACLVINDLTEVYVNAAGAVYQNDKLNRFVVSFNGSVATYKVQQFLSLKKQADALDLEAMAKSESRATDIEIITVAGSEQLYVLTLADAIAFKDLMTGAKVMLELNSILHERLYSELV
ncbi:MAG: hypothetical protein LPJ89_08270 [Hymenobacteraceae bacterium]|nr:hypothetical protein [Hymenobacteraceae bacterium]